MWWRAQLRPGSVQKTIELPDGAALLLTVAKYQTAAGKKIQDEAVMPTVVSRRRAKTSLMSRAAQERRTAAEGD